MHQQTLMTSQNSCWRRAAHKKPAHTHNAPALIGINAKYIIGEWFYPNRLYILKIPIYTNKDSERGFGVKENILLQ